MLTDNEKHWKPVPELLDFISSFIPPGAKVLEIGPGDVPFARATHTVDLGFDKNAAPCDINSEKIPYPDKFFDFIYCRHVLEDLYNPFWACDEMSRVGKAGYIETPSPAAEVTRGIDGRSPVWRGYHHHRYFVWESSGILSFAAKFPIVEHITFDGEDKIVEMLKKDPLTWNTSYFWKDRIAHRHLQHDCDFQITDSYARVLVDAINQGFSETRKMQTRLTRFKPSDKSRPL